MISYLMKFKNSQNWLKNQKRKRKIHKNSKKCRKMRRNIIRHTRQLPFYQKVNKINKLKQKKINILNRDNLVTVSVHNKAFLHLIGYVFVLTRRGAIMICLHWLGTSCTWTAVSAELKVALLRFYWTCPRFHAYITPASFCLSQLVPLFEE